MKIVIRTDASFKIGSGHIMRCLNLALGLRKVESDVIFFSRNLSGNMNSFILENDFGLVELSKPENKQISNVNYSRGLFVSQEQDAKETISNIQGEVCDWLVVDHYGLDQKWETLLRPYVKNIMVIDDFLNRAHDCDLLLNQNYFLKKSNLYKELVAPETKLLLGPKYALLSKDYLIARKKNKIHKGKINRVLIYFGSSPNFNLLSKVFEVFKNDALSHIALDIVIGMNTPRIESIKSFSESRPNSIVHTLVPNLVELMCKSHLFIGAGGITTWERICLGLPSIIITTGKNQELSSKALATKRYQQYLGDSHIVTKKKISNAIMRTLNSPNMLIEQSKLCKALVDANGVERVSKSILKIVR